MDNTFLGLEVVVLFFLFLFYKLYDFVDSKRSGFRLIK